MDYKGIILTTSVEVFQMNMKILYLGAILYKQFLSGFLKPFFCQVTYLGNQLEMFKTIWTWEHPKNISVKFGH